MNDYQQPESSEAIKADIEQTRAEMGAKIDQLQQKLDPNRLKEEAQATVQNFLTESSDSIMDYLRTNRQEISTSVVDAVKRNPIPTALIALGMGWLLVESMSSRSEGYERDYQSYQDRNRYLPMGREQGMGYRSSAYASGYRGEYNVGYGSSPYGAPYDRSYDSGYGASYQSSPYAGGQGWQPDVQGREQWSGQSSGQWQGGQYQGDNGGSWTDEVKQQAQDAARKVGEKASDAVDAVRNTASNVAGAVGERIQGGAEQVGQRMSDMGHQTRDQASRLGHQLGDRSQAAGMQARQMGRQVGHQVSHQVGHQVEENPFMVGALAFAAGVAVAMLLPQTRMENRAMGQARDQVMETAQEIGQDVVQRAERVVEEVRPEVEQTVRRVVEDVKQTGKEAAQELQDTAQKAQDRAKQEAKAEGEQIKSKAKAATGQSTGGQSTSGMPSNWNTVKGQWTQWKGEAKRQWGKLTDDDLTRIEGDYEKLVGLLQQKYSYSRSQAEQEITNFSRTTQPKQSV